MDPADSGLPIGIYEELIEHGLDPKVFGSCSAPGPENRGCVAWKKCRFIQYRDRMNGYIGPENIGCIVITPENAADGKIMTCAEFYQTGLNAMREHSADSGSIVEIVGLVGSEVLTQGSRRLHMKKDPNCPDCQKNSCQRIERWEKLTKVEPYKRLSNMKEETTQGNYKLGYAQRLRAQVRQRVEQENNQRTLDRVIQPLETETLPSHEGVGTGRYTKAKS